MKWNIIISLTDWPNNKYIATSGGFQFTDKPALLKHSLHFIYN